MSSPLTRLSATLTGLGLALAVVATPAHGGTTAQVNVLRGDACNHADPATPAPAAASVRVSTFNIRADKSPADVADALNALLPGVDVAGLQEINSKDKAQVLANLANDGWDFWRQYRTHIPQHPRQGGTEQQPLLWRSDRFVCTYAGPALMSPIFSLGQEKYPSYDDVQRHYFTVVHLVDKVTGQKLAFINVHLVQGVIKGGRPVPGIPRHVKLYRMQLAHVVAKAEQQQGYGQVFVLGDFNAGYLQDLAHKVKGLPWKKFHRIRYRSMWATETPSNGMGTHDNALIDQVWTGTKAADAQVLFNLKGYSDHLPAVATYSMPPVAPAG
jgi:endonuclease/exonuclease/phosphatase family metal-dependent hydrolase